MSRYRSHPSICLGLSNILFGDLLLRIARAY
jgi:hypothetical protein